MFLFLMDRKKITTTTKPKKDFDQISCGMGEVYVVASKHTLTRMSHHSNQQQHKKKKKMQVYNTHYVSAADNVIEEEGVLSKLNPLAKEFVPRQHHHLTPTPRNKGVHYHGKRRMNNRTQKDDVIKRTVYVSNIHHQVSEQQLASLFLNCGHIVDCRICGHPKSHLRFAFIEFTHIDGAQNAFTLDGSILGYYPLKILPSKTAIAPVNPTFLPHSENEMEICARTIYCTNIDRKVTSADVRLFFESLCGEVHRLKMLGDHQHFSQIAFVEFVMAESATAALNCSGAVLGTLPIRVSPSKTPVRPRARRTTTR